MECENKRPLRSEGRQSVARAEYLLASGDPKAALASARQVLRRDREQVGALEVLAKAQWQLGRYPDLLVTLATLIRLNPYEPGYFALRGAVYQSLGRVGDAVREFARAGEAVETSGASVEELREWQGAVIAQLLNDDPVFRTHYAQDPEEACRLRGFEFLPDYRVGETWLAKPAAQTALHTRPS